MTRRPRFVIALAAAVALIGLAPDGAGARPASQPDRDDWLIAPEGVQPGLRTANGQACVKQCPDDMLPCDPPSFKQADGRCTTAWH